MVVVVVVGRPGLSQTKTNSAQAEAGARAELGKKHTDVFLAFLGLFWAIV